MPAIILSSTNLQSTLDQYQQIYLGLLKSLEANRSAGLQSTASLTQLDPAVAPKAPVRPMPALYVLLGGFIGLALAAAALLVVDHLNNPLKTARQAEGLLGVSVLGRVSDGGQTGKRLAGLHAPTSADAEADRALGASIDLVSAGRNLWTIMVTCAGTAECETNVAANLAYAFAQQGKRVILVDADRKHPHLHTLFGVANEKGWADIVKGGRRSNGTSQSISSVEGLTLIPGGNAAKDSTGWVDAEKWLGLFNDWQKLADLVIVESPPAELADTQTLASKVDVALLVVREGQTHADWAQAAVTRFQLAGAKVVGIVWYGPHNRPTSGSRLMIRLKGLLHREEREAAGRSETQTAATLPP